MSRRRPVDVGRDEGAVSLLFVIVAIAVVSAIALVVDGGRRLGALTEAQDLADNAARAGAQAVDAQVFRDTGEPEIDEPQARANIAAFMASIDTSSEAAVSSIEVVGSNVTVEITIAAPRSIVWPSRTVSATETANAIAGTDGT